MIYNKGMLCEAACNIRYRQGKFAVIKLYVKTIFLLAFNTCMLMENWTAINHSELYCIKILKWLCYQDCQLKFFFLGSFAVTMTQKYDGGRDLFIMLISILMSHCLD